MYFKDDFGATGSAYCPNCDLKWKKTPPNEPGYYWCYNRNRRLYLVLIERNYFDDKLSVYAIKDEFRYNLKDIIDAYWQGPLPMPELPEKD